MQREWEPEDLIGSWTLVEHDERELVAYKRGATRLGFALMLKFFEIDARFPRHVGEYPPAAVDYVARQVGVDPGELAPITNGPDAPLSITAPRSDARCGSVVSARTTRPSWPAGSPRRSPRSSCPMSGCVRRCWPAAGPNGSNHRHGWTAFSAPPAPRSATGSPPRSSTGSPRRRWPGWTRWQGSAQTGRTRPVERGWPS